MLRVTGVVCAGSGKAWVCLLHCAAEGRGPCIHLLQKLSEGYFGGVPWQHLSLDLGQGGRAIVCTSQAGKSPFSWGESHALL